MTEYSDLPFYEKLLIFERLPHDKFKLLCITDREMLPICSGNLTQDIIEKHDDRITERLYHNRSDNMFNSSLLAFKPNNMSWKDFYTRLNKFLDDLDDLNAEFYQNYMDNLIQQGLIMEAKILKKI